MKTVAHFFTLPEKLPKTALLPLGRTTKSPGHSFQSARGKSFFYQFMGLILVATYTLPRFTRYSVPVMPLILMVSTAIAPFWYW